MSTSVNHIFRHESFPFDLDQWYPIMEPITFKTYFIPLKLEQAEAITQYYSTYYLGKEGFTIAHTRILEDLESQIDNLFTTTPLLREKGAFLRLCGRSPKDGEPYDPERFYEEYRSNLHYLVEEKHLDPTEGNTKIWAIAKTHWLVVRNAKDCLSLLLSSKKVYTDLSDWQNFGGKEQLCFREWDKDLDDDNEFRGFVYENKLTAITQYDHFGRFDDIIKARDKIEKMIHQFWETEVKHRMKVDCYIVDFGYVNNKMILIEVSPFLRTTGAGCLSWDYDAHELRYGSGKLKVASKSNPNADHLASSFETQWEDSTDYKDNFIKSDNENSKSENKNFIKSVSENKNSIFVASVLKKGFFWNQKYLSYAEFINDAELIDHGMLIDSDGMGWIVNEKMKLRGEVWIVNDNDLRDIEYFYGKSCKKEMVTVKTVNGDVINDVICFVSNVTKKENDSLVEEFTSDNEINYNNIAHEERKQEKYLNMSYRFPLEEAKHD